MGGILDRITAMIGSDDDSYEVAEYVLTRIEPDTDNRLRTFEEPIEPSALQGDEDLPAGTYILQEVKPHGVAGEIVWEAELGGAPAAE